MNQFRQFIEYVLSVVKFWVIIHPWQSGLRVRKGTKVKVLSAGIHFKIPYFDSVFIQENRMRVLHLTVQTVTSLDGQTITLNGAVGYSISNIEKLYNTLYHPEMTIQNICMSHLSYSVSRMNISEITPNDLSSGVLEMLEQEDYGLKFEYFKITNFAVVRAYRLIQDQSWISEGLDMHEIVK